MFRVAVLLPESFRDGCSFGAGKKSLPVSSNDVQTELEELFRSQNQGA
jgi:hypothetical protein